MFDLYFWPTPNGYKPMLFLEEIQADYRLVPININANEQFAADFLKIAPNNRIPALVDHQPTDRPDSFSLFESAAILLYLAEKTGKFLPTDFRTRHVVLQWLFWQMGGLGPMLGQNHHFALFAPEKIPYAIERYRKETRRLYSVLNQQLIGHEFISGDDYSIADMACYPWIVPHERQGVDLSDYPEVERWFATIQKRPATQQAYAKGATVTSPK